MGYRRAKNLDKNLIFQEYFNSEQEVRRNVGSLAHSFDNYSSFSNGAWITSQSGIGTNNDFIRTPHMVNIGDDFSVRIKIKFNSIGSTNQYFFSGGRVESSRNYLALNATGKWFHANWDSGKIYVNTEQVLQNAVDAETGVIYDVVGVASSSAYALEFTLGCYGDINRLGVDAEIYSVEIYNKALTAEEVTNLYNDARYAMPNLEHSAQIESELITGLTNSSSHPYETLSISGTDILSAINTVGNASVYTDTSFEVVSTGERYLFRGYLTLNSGTAPQIVIAQDGNAISGAKATSTSISEGWNEIILTTTGTGVGCEFLIWVSAAASNFSLTSISFGKLSVEPTSKILHVTAKNGVVQNLLARDTAQGIGGSSLMASGKGTFDDGTVEAVQNFGGYYNIIENENNALKVTYVDNGNGFICALSSAEHLLSNLTSGKTYRVIAKVKGTTGTTCYLRVYNGSIWIADSTLPDEYETRVIEFTAATGSSERIQLGSFTTGDMFYMDWWRVEEVIPEPTLTDVEVVKDGDVYSPLFNGDTSKIDCGGYNDLTGDISILSWIKLYDYGEGTGGRGSIINNGKLVLSAYGLSSNLVFDRDAGSEVLVNVGSVVTKQKYIFVVVTSASSGSTNFYINGDLAVSSHAAGIPVAGSTNITIGNLAGQTRGYDGPIPEIIVLSGLLTAEEISQYYTATKHKYGK